MLLALIGTAMISTAGVDRYASVQHTFNTQVDLLVEGMKEVAEGYIRGSQYQTSVNGTGTITMFRPADTEVAANSTYEKYDWLDIVDNDVSNLPAANDAWLASRVPQAINIALAFDPNNNPAAWQALTMPLVPQPIAAGMTTSRYQFESPYSPAPNQYVPLTTTIRAMGSSGGTPIYPYPIPITTASGATYPVMMVNSVQFMAADTDGDGIADALYFKLGTGADGITYYAACRIIDNNSAINANTAWCRDFDFTNAAGGFNRNLNQAAGIFNYGIYRSNVGLMEMFPDYVAPAAAGSSRHFCPDERHARCVKWYSIHQWDSLQHFERRRGCPFECAGVLPRFHGCHS